MRKYILIILNIILIFVLIACETNNSDGKFENETNEGIVFKLYIPEEFDDKETYNLVVMLHGCGQTANLAASYTTWNDLADKEKFLVLYPQQNSQNHNKVCWNWYKAPYGLSNELEIITNYVIKIKNEYNINKTFVTGLSAGAGMANNLAVLYNDVYDGLGVVAGPPYKLGSSSIEANMALISKTNKTAEDFYNLIIEDIKEINKLIPTIVFHGSNDKTVISYNGNLTADSWGLYNGAIKTTNDYDNYSLYTYTNEKLIGKYYLINDFSHLWPVSSNNNANIDATSLSYEFWVNYYTN